jgi:pimeloyl-ACP methyl ester carboxylesterase
MKIHVNGITLNYEKTGEGPPLILIHGNSEDLSIFLPMTKVLKKHFTVYLVDSRDHGKSQKVPVLRYEDMADDIAAFIQELKIEKPVLYGFSDGGIIGLLLAIRYPHLLSALVISGANVHPKGIKARYRLVMQAGYYITRDNKLSLMLNQPNITAQKLQSISVPTHITAGSNDMIKESHTRRIHTNIKNSRLIIYPNHTHDSYILKSTLMLRYLIQQFSKNTKQYHNTGETD